MHNTLRLALLLCSSVAAPASILHAQQPSDDESDQQVVVTGKAPRGSAIGNIPPENVLHSRDVRATGATSFDELLEAIAPEIGSATGSGSARPLVLLNGHRVSSYRELRDIPIEAISRIDILPEEVALRYGYPANQKVVNVVLQNHFSENVAQAAANKSTHKGFGGGSGDFTRIQLGTDRRDVYNLHVGSDDILTGSQRALVQQQYDTQGTGVTGLLLPSELRLRGTGTVTRELPNGIEATGNAQVDFNKGHSLSGLSQQLPAELNRDTTAESLHLGGTLTGDHEKWHWHVTGNGEVDHEETSTTRLGQAFAPGSAASTRASADVDATLNGPLFAMPAGDADVTLRVAGSTEHLDIDQRDFPTPPSGSTNRTTGTSAISLDLPVSRRGKALGALGTLTLNGNVEADALTDFGILRRYGVGANWAPVPRVSVIGSWNHQEVAPTVRQLGDPFLETPGTRIFDFTNGVVERTSVVTGGNPDLRTERRNTLDLSAHWQPFDTANFRLRADYAHVRIDSPISDITVFPVLEAAFPYRFVRDTSGALMSVDLRPVNFRSARRDTLQLGFDFTRPLKSMRPSQSDIKRIVDQARAGGAAVPESAVSSVNAALAALGQSGPTKGRLTFSLTDTITFVDRAVVDPKLPELDYLHGAPIGQTGGQPRHQVQAQAGWSNNGLGARLGFNWRSDTTVFTDVGDTLHYSPLATFDLRLFANVGQYLPIVSRHPWLRGASLRFEVGNILNTHPQVRGESGIIPIGYEPNMLDPLGRTFMLSFRKQFLPRSYYEQQLEKAAKPQQP